MAGNAQLKLRRDSAADWTSADPTLAEGEPGFETDTGKLKIGDGSTAWSSLTYLAGGAGGGGGGWALEDSWVQSVDGTVASIEVTNLDATDIMVIVQGVTLSTSGRVVMLVSVNNGSSYYNTSGDYVAFDGDGVAFNSDSVTSVNSNHTAARTAVMTVHSANLDGVPKFFTAPARRANQFAMGIFSASTSPIDAIKIQNFAGGNLTGGAIYILTR